MVELDGGTQVDRCWVEFLLLFLVLISLDLLLRFEFRRFFERASLRYPRTRAALRLVQFLQLLVRLRRQLLAFLILGNVNHGPSPGLRVN